MLHDKSDGVFINEPFPLLAGVHQALLADPVNHPENSGGSLLDYICRNIREEILATAGVAEVGPNVLLRFRLLQLP